jgi:hypothetical protein
MCAVAAVRNVSVADLDGEALAFDAGGLDALRGAATRCHTALAAE